MKVCDNNNYENDVTKFFKKCNNGKKRFKNNFDEKFLISISDALNDINLNDDSPKRNTTSSRYSKYNTKKNSGVIIVSDRDDEDKLSVVSEILNLL